VLSPNIRKEENKGKWYNMATWHSVRDLLKEGGAGVSGDESLGEPSHKERRQDCSQTSQAHPQENKKWR
jgi:hypothetical protein